MAEWMTIDGEPALRSYEGFPRVQLDLEMGALSVGAYFEVVGADGSSKSTHHLDDLPQGALPGWVVRRGDGVVVPSFVEPARFQRALASALAQAARELASETADSVIVYAPFAWTLGEDERERFESKVAILTMNDRRTREAVWATLGEGDPEGLFERLPNKLTRKLGLYVEPRMRGAYRAFFVALDAQARVEGGMVTLEDHPLVNEVSPKRRALLALPSRRDTKHTRDSFAKALDHARKAVGDEARGRHVWLMLAKVVNTLGVPQLGAQAHTVAADIYEAMGDEAQRDAHRGWASRLEAEQ